MNTRRESRLASAAYLNSLGADELFGLWGITRVARLDGLDTIGVPVYSGIRPAGKVLSVSAGKGVDRALARAGAIAEGIEYHVFENPSGSFEVDKCADLGFPLQEYSTWNTDIPVAVEPITHLKTGKNHLFPSRLIWLVDRDGRHSEKRFFQHSSNGQALGSRPEDALLHGLYECIERDQVTLRSISLSRLGAYPPRVKIPQSCDQLLSTCRKSSLSLYLFLCSIDIPIPVYWAIIVDPEWRSTGGYGCSLDSDEAATRAITEAIQGRAVVISGARDDIDRRVHGYEQAELMKNEIGRLPEVSHKPTGNLNVSSETELELVLDRLGPWSDRIFYRHIPINEHLCAVKVQVLGFEQPIIRSQTGWQAIRWHKLRESYMQAQAFTG